MKLSYRARGAFATNTSTKTSGKGGFRARYAVLCNDYLVIFVVFAFFVRISSTAPYFLASSADMK